MAMEDQVLSSMCKGPVSYYTLAEQREDSTRHKISQREISRRGNTCTLDHPTNSDIEHCIAVAKSRFKAYTESHIEAHFPAAQPNSIDNQNALDGRSCSANDQLVPPVSHKRTITAEPSGELIRPPPPKKQRIDKTDALVAELVENTTLWLKDGLKNLSKKTLPTLPTLSNLSPSDPKDKASTLADQLWKLADDIENAAAGVVWSMRYTAACSSLLGAFSVKKGNRQNIHNWRGLVHIVNSIVNLMLPTWKDKAYLLYHVFAVKGSLLSSVARLSEEKRQKFASGIANALDRLTFPSEIEGVPLFNPARVLSGMIHNISHEEICNAIWLPLAMDSDTIEAERSTFLIPNMATLSHRVKELSALPAQVRSGNISSTPSLSPPPTPPTFQQAYSTGTGENMERCNTDKINQSSTTTNIGANLAQVGDLPPSYRNDVEATFDEFGKSLMTETPEAVTPDDAPTSNAMRPVENTGIDAWSTDHLRHSFHLPSMPPRPEGSSEAQPVTINLNSAERLQVLSASGSGQGVADSMDINMLDSLGRACYLPHALESDPSLERTINPNLLSMDTNMLSSLDNARFLSDALDAGMLSTLDNARFLSDALESDLNAERSQPQFHHAEDENMVWDQNDTNTDLGIVV